MSEQIKALGVAWYTRQNYARVLAVMEDAHLLPDTFDAWLYKAEKLLKDVVREGGVPIKAHIDPETFVAWCRARGLNVDANARRNYCADFARAVYVDGHG